MKLDPNADGAIARFPRLAMAADKSYVIGVDFQLADDLPMAENPLHVWRTDGLSMGRPAGHFKYLFPRDAVDARGRIHLIWGEPAENTGAVSTRRWYVLQTQTLWTATFDPSAGWSKPAKLHFTASGVDGLKWDAAGTADSFGSGRAQGMGLEERRRRRDAPLDYLALDESGRWRRSHIHVPRFSTAIAVLADDQRILAFYASPAPEPGAVMLRVSRDRGETWDLPGPVTTAGGQVRDLHAITARDREVHLVWREMTPRGSTIRQAISSDAGETWSVQADLVLPGIEKVQSVIDSCGVLHVLGEHWQDGPHRLHIDYARFDGSWSEVEHIFSDRTAMTPDLQLTSGGQPVMVFVAQVEPKPSTRFATYYSAMQR